MADQLDMPSGHKFYEAINCTYTKREYYEHLAGKHPDEAAAIRALLKNSQQ